MNLVVVIPAYNEAGRIGEVVRAVRAQAATVVVVDDGSKDRTGAEAIEAGAIVLIQEVNRGQGASLRTGVEAALRLGAEAVVHFDADGQHDPRDIPELIAPIISGEADIVYGSRFLGVAPKGVPLTRRLLFFPMRWFNVIFLGIPAKVTDPQSGLRAFSRRAASSIKFSQDRMAHCSELLQLATRGVWRWKEVPVLVRYSDETLKKGNKTSDAFRIVWQLFLGAWRK